MAKKDDNYTIKEFITHRFADVATKIDDLHFDVKEVVTQTTKTNGRVSKLEWWRNAVITALTAVWAVMLIIFPYLLETERERNRVDIQNTITQSLESLVSQVEYEK